MDEVTQPIKVSEVAPHAGRMALLRHVLAHGEDGTLCDAEIRPDSVFFEDGRVPAWAALEYMAQAAAAHSGMLARSAGERLGPGFLVGARRVALLTRGFPPGQVLHVLAERAFESGGMSAFRCSVRDAAGERLLAEADLRVFDPGDTERPQG